MSVNMHTVRLVVLAVVIIFSIIVLSLSAHLTSTTASWADYYFDFAALGIAISVLTFVTVIPLLVFDIIRTGFITSRIVVELIVLGILSILWLATGADTADANSFVAGCGVPSRMRSRTYGPDGPDGPSYQGATFTACHEIQAIEAFSFLNWLILMGYTMALLFLSLTASNRGHKVWNSSVKETNFSARATNTGVSPA